MYAIIKTGGKQYKVKEGQMIKIEKLDAEAGDEVSFEKVLQYSDEEEYKFGRPYIEDAEVTGKVLEQGKGDKIVVLKYKPKRRYSKKTGHRQPYTKVLIENIEL